MAPQRAITAAVRRIRSSGDKRSLSRNSESISRTGLPDTDVRQVGRNARHRHGFLPDPEIEPDGLQIPGYLACDARFGGGKRNRLGEQQPLGRRGLVAEHAQIAFVAHPLPRPGQIDHGQTFAQTGRAITPSEHQYFARDRLGLPIESRLSRTGPAAFDVLQLVAVELDQPIRAGFPAFVRREYRLRVHFVKLLPVAHPIPDSRPRPYAGKGRPAPDVFRSSSNGLNDGSTPKSGSR